MEDILASIRRILSEDEEEPPSASGKSAIESMFEPESEPESELEPELEPEPEPEPAFEPEFLEPEPEPVFEPEPERMPIPLFEPESEAEDVLELTDDMLVEEVERPFVPPLPRPLSSQARPQMEPEGNESLMSPPTAALSAAALGELARTARERTVLLGHGEITLEAMVREALRPLLKAWLDEHLPSMVERIVAREIERLVHQVSDDHKW
ncbi:MAG: hypothetical protein FD149_2080 [Rhodospirillaceae bacterium]|nr:MAG: hypothetical protein FD149_2080 [Rhodospirillaceae bacterium]